MRNKNRILNTLGTFIKCFSLLMTVDNVILIFYFSIVESDVDIIGYLVPLAVLSGLLTFAGLKLEKFRSKKVSQPPVSQPPVKQPLIKKPAVETDYKPVISRTGEVKNGEFIYVFKNNVDLFADGRQGLAYQELSGSFQIVANLGKHILDNGGLIRSIYIGGGSDEVAHTGTVAYSKGYSSLESFVENCMKDIDRAESDAGMEYGVWFSSLDYKYVIIEAKLKETDIKVEYSYMGSSIAVSIRLGNGCEGFSYLTDLIRKFGAEDFSQGVGADEPFWDASLKIFRRTFQLEETKTFFWTSYMSAEGDFIKYSLDVETEDAVHYEILPKKINQLTRILQEELNQRYVQNPEAGCAYYLQNHSGLDLIALLKKHNLINQEIH